MLSLVSLAFYLSAIATRKVWVGTWAPVLYHQIKRYEDFSIFKEELKLSSDQEILPRKNYAELLNHLYIYCAIQYNFQSTEIMRQIGHSQIYHLSFEYFVVVKTKS